MPQPDATTVPDDADPGAREVALPVAWAREDLCRAVREAIAAEGHLLCAGEVVVARRLLALEPAAAALYARLWGRRGELFRLDGLRYAEVPDLPAAVDALVAAELASRGAALLPASHLARALTVDELRAACRALGRSPRGRRAELLDRVGDPAARPALVRPLIQLRHAGLFRRLVRIFLGSRHGDLSRLVLERLELARYPAYTPTGGMGFFPDRRSLLAWEEGLALDEALAALPARECGAALLACLDSDLSRVEREPPPPPWRARFSARTLAAQRAAQAARQLEREGRAGSAATVYARLLSAGAPGRGELLLRQALALDAAGDPGQGARLCADALRPGAPSPPSPAEALALA
ncbi:hypothetical protein L6R53_22275, partial [Myxococcota bacterium]|nr:hypothetical protein [Myxococcota bacterium]